MTEILSPAGDFESLISAVVNGADAVYMGVENFNARIMTNNFTLDKYIEAIEYAHARNVKIYLTLNTLIKDNEIREAMEILIKLYKHKLDAVIVQDIGIASIIRKVLPKLDIHASTQMSVHNLKQVKVLEKMGFKRAVLAREMTLDEIKYIKENTNLELEIFVHGALCVAYSGQCLMSSMIGARSGNRGKCAGTCRMTYSLIEDGKTIEDNKYLISKKDIFGIDYIKDLIDIGIDSLKIEGRSKSKEYVGLVTNKYVKAKRAALENSEKITLQDKYELLQMFNRGEEHVGYFDGVKARESITYKMAKNVGVYLGKVVQVLDNNLIKVKLELDISMHDGIEVHTYGDKIVSSIITCIKDEKGKLVNSNIQKGNICIIGDIKQRVKVGDEVYKTSSKLLIDKYDKIAKEREKVIDIDVKLKIKENENISMNVLDKEIQIEYIPEIAKNKSIDKEYIQSAINKSDKTPYRLNISKLILDNNLYVPISKLNTLRRVALEYLQERNKSTIDVENNFKKLDEVLNRKIESGNNSLDNNAALYIYRYNRENVDIYLKDENMDIYINICDIKRDEELLENIYLKKKIYIVIPNIVLKNLDKYIEENIERLVSKYNIKGIVVGNIGYFEIARKLKDKYNIKIVADYSLNVYNTFSAKVYETLGSDIITISTELLDDEAKCLKDNFNIQVVDGFVTAMTTRFCVVKSYSKCMNCDRHKYILKDSHNLCYDVICDNTDCIIKFVREKENTIKSKSVRKCIIE